MNGAILRAKDVPLIESLYLVILRIFLQVLRYKIVPLLCVDDSYYQIEPFPPNICIKQNLHHHNICEIRVTLCHFRNCQIVCLREFCCYE